MVEKLSICALLVCCLCGAGCASTLEDTNKGAKEVGRTGGQVMRVPHSLGEGVSEGVAGEAESNPYDR
jgi:hypothetical protein